jgi:hypothetical protein
MDGWHCDVPDGPLFVAVQISIKTVLCNKQHRAGCGGALSVTVRCCWDLMSLERGTARLECRKVFANWMSAPVRFLTHFRNMATFVEVTELESFLASPC